MANLRKIIGKNRNLSRTRKGGAPALRLPALRLPALRLPAFRRPAAFENHKIYDWTIKNGYQDFTIKQIINNCNKNLKVEKFTEGTVRENGYNIKNVNMLEEMMKKDKSFEEIYKNYENYNQIWIYLNIQDIKDLPEEYNNILDIIDNISDIIKDERFFYLNEIVKLTQSKINFTEEKLQLFSHKELVNYSTIFWHCIKPAQAAKYWSPQALEFNLKKDKTLLDIDNENSKYTLNLNYTNLITECKKEESNRNAIPLLCKLVNDSNGTPCCSAIHSITTFNFKDTAASSSATTNYILLKSASMISNNGEVSIKFKLGSGGSCDDNIKEALYRETLEEIGLQNNDIINNVKCSVNVEKTLRTEIRINDVINKIFSRLNEHPVNVINIVDLKISLDSIIDENVIKELTDKLKTAEDYFNGENGETICYFLIPLEDDLIDKWKNDDDKIFKNVKFIGDDKNKALLSNFLDFDNGNLHIKNYSKNKEAFEFVHEQIHLINGKINGKFEWLIKTKSSIEIESTEIPESKFKELYMSFTSGGGKRKRTKKRRHTKRRKHIKKRKHTKRRR